jgi:hypothetical protein
MYDMSLRSATFIWNIFVCRTFNEIQHTIAVRGGYVLENPRERQNRDATIAVEVHSVWHDIYIATIDSYWDRRADARAVVYYSVRLRKSDRERARDIRRDAQKVPQ